MEKLGVVFVIVRENVVKRRGSRSNGPLKQRGGWGMRMAAREKGVCGWHQRSEIGKGWN